MIVPPFPDSPPTATDVRLVRHPIFDAGNRRVGYEIAPVETAASPLADAPSAPPAVPTDATLRALAAIGIDRLAGFDRAWVRLDADALAGDAGALLPPDRIAFLVPAEPATPERAAAVASAIEAGHRVALDAWADQPVWRPLLHAVHAVRIAPDGLDDDAVAQLLVALAAHPAVERHAIGVATGAARMRTARLGFTHFVGPFYARPEVLGTRTLGMEQATIVRLLGLAADPDVSDRALEEAFRSHPALVHGLLRIVHSAEIAGRGVGSVTEAVRLLGRARLSRWLMVLLATGAAAYGPLAREAVTSALARARFCELVAQHGGNGNAAERFLVGLLSHLDGLLGQPMGTVLERLPVTADMRDALMHGVGPHAPVLELAVTWEGGRIAATSVTDASLGRCYADAVAWAAECLAPADAPSRMSSAA